MSSSRVEGLVDRRVEGLVVGPVEVLVRISAERGGSNSGRSCASRSSPGRFDYWHWSAGPTAHCDAVVAAVLDRSAGGPGVAGTGLGSWQ
jgi:hypothetical protein